MNRRQKIIVSITGIFLVLLILVGLTYAYFLTRINGNNNDRSISVTTANLELTYGDGTNTVLTTSDPIIPSNDPIGVKDFTVTNNGNATVDNYAVYLEEIENKLTRTSDLVYTLTCTSSVSNKSCNGKSETVYPNKNGILVTNSIDKDEVQTYVLTLTYKEMNEDQSADMNKTINGKIQIYNLKDIVDIEGTVTNALATDYVQINSVEKKSQIINGEYKLPAVEPGTHTIRVFDKDGIEKSSRQITIKKGNTAGVSGNTITVTGDSQTISMTLNRTTSSSDVISNTINDYSPFEPGTLAYKIYNSAKTGGTNKTTFGSEVTTFTTISGKNERVLNSAPDDYGTSYYYRGNVIDNYVSFADKTWRIVRINGDGTVRLVLDDIAKDSSGNVIKTAFNSSNNDNAYVGYMYGTAGSTTYAATHENKNESTIKIAVDKWYEDNLKTYYSNYLADTLFCNDKTLASSSIGASNTALGYGTNRTYYSSAERLYYRTGTTSITTSKPTFKCAENATNNYSRFTVNVTTLPNGNKTNGNLKYPIGLLTADEVSFAGAYKYEQTNRTYYLYNSSITSTCWLLSPYIYLGSLAHGSSFSWSDGSIDYMSADYNFVLRPSINLKANILVARGDGTSSNPYTVKIS